jgi:integrase
MGRRGNGEGGISRRKDGLYMARYTIETATGTKRETIYAKTRREAAERLSEALANRDKGLVFDAGNMTVGEYVTRWLEDSAKGDLAARTYHNYRLQLRQHIIPSIGRVKLSKLSPANVQALYAAKLRDGLKPSSVRYIHAVLHRALEQAVKWNLIPRNPARAADPPKIREDEITPLNSEQARRFLDAAAREKFEALYVLSLTAGLRMGEALGLRWTDIDLDAQTLRVNRQLQRMRRDGVKSGTLEFSEPKNASRRTIDLSQRALEALSNHRKQQVVEQLKAGSNWQDNGLVFATGKGTALDAQNVVNRGFKPLLRRTDLPDIRWHDLRHTCFTLLLSRGVHPKYVQMLAGHASIQLTLDRYSHWMPSMGKHTANAMDDALADREDDTAGEEFTVEESTPIGE